MCWVLDLRKSWIIEHCHRSNLSPEAFHSIAHYKALYYTAWLGQSHDNSHALAGCLYRLTDCLVLHLRWNFLDKFYKTVFLFTIVAQCFVHLSGSKKVSFVNSKSKLIILWWIGHQLCVLKLQLDLNLFFRVRKNTRWESHLFLIFLFLL